MLDGWTPDAVVFDCDGLLMDTEPCWLAAERDMFALRGLTFGSEEHAAFLGHSIQANSRAMAELFGEPGGGEAIEREVLGSVAARIMASAAVMPGAWELVELVAARVPVAVATNSPRALLEATLRRGGFETSFAVSVALDEVAAPKPDPAIYIEVCRRLDLAPTRVLALEDSAAGIAAARAAGVRVIAVPTLAGTCDDADALVGSLADPQLVAWCASWSVRDVA